MRDRTIVVDSFSKTNAMTVIRLGYAYGPESVISSMRTIQEDVVSCITAPAQYARNRDLIMRAVARMPGEEYDSIEGAFYAFPSIRAPGWAPGTSPYGC